MGWPLTRQGLMTVAAAVAVVLAAGWWMIGEDDAWAEIHAKGRIRVGYAVESPYAFVAEGGRVTGFSPELARLVIADLDVPRTEWVQTEFDRLIPELRDGRFDVIAAGMFIDPARADRVGFSEPVLKVACGLGVATANPRAYASYADVVADSSARIGVIAGSVEELRFRELGMSPTHVLALPDAAVARSALESGAVTALALSLPTLRAMAAAGVAITPVKLAGCAEPTASVGFVFRRKEDRLRREWDHAQAVVLGRPAYRALIASFGFDPDSAPGSPAR